MAGIFNYPPPVVFSLCCGCEWVGTPSRPAGRHIFPVTGDGAVTAWPRRRNSKLFANKSSEGAAQHPKNFFNFTRTAQRGSEARLNIDFNVLWTLRRTNFLFSEQGWARALPKIEKSKILGKSWNFIRIPIPTILIFNKISKSNPNPSSTWKKMATPRQV